MKPLGGFPGGAVAPSGLFLFCFLTAAGLQAQTPVYQWSLADTVWSNLGGGVFQAPTNSELYSAELWERPLEDGKRTLVGENWQTTGKYYGYGDLTNASFGWDGTYLYGRFDSATSNRVEFGGAVSQDGLKGTYNLYFGFTNTSGVHITNEFALRIADPGSAVVTEGVWTSNGVAKVFQDVNNNVRGTGTLITYEDNTNEINVGDCYEIELSGASAALAVRRTGTAVEFALPYFTFLGLTTNDLMSLDYIIFGIAESNPSGVNQLWANDEFYSADGFGVEYDTVVLRNVEIPEPSMMALATPVVGAVLLGLRRRRR